jgi:hypothetical protein
VKAKWDQVGAGDGTAVPVGAWLWRSLASRVVDPATAPRDQSGGGFSDGTTRPVGGLQRNRRASRLAGFSDGAVWPVGARLWSCDQTMTKQISATAQPGDGVCVGYRGGVDFRQKPFDRSQERTLICWIRTWRDPIW